MNNYYGSPLDVKKTLKTCLIYLLIAFPFVAVAAVLLTLTNAPLWAIMLCNVVTGGAVILVTYFIHGKIKEKKKHQQENKPKKFDPFKD